MMAFGEAKVVADLVPDDFKPYFEQWGSGAGAASNDTIDSIVGVGSDEGVDTFKIVAKTPWPSATV